MNPKNKIQWKNPYKKNIRNCEITQIYKNIAGNNAGNITPFLKKLTKNKRKSFLEIELSKYIYQKRIKSSKKYFFLGSFFSLIYYTYISKKRFINENVIDKGKFLVFNNWVFLRKRQFSFYFWNFIDLNLNLFGQSFSNRPRDDYLEIEKVKLDYVLAQQIQFYRNNKDDLFDFLSIGEEEIFKLN